MVQVMVWRQTCDKPLPESMMIWFTDAYCVLSQIRYRNLILCLVNIMKYTHTHTHTYIYIYIHTYIQISIYIYIYIYSLL